MPTISSFFGIVIWMYFDDHGIPRVKKVEPRESYRLYVEFTDGVKGEVNLSNRLFGSVFEPLKDPDLFRQVTVDEFGAVVWPNGADLAPDGLYARLRSDDADAA